MRLQARTLRTCLQTAVPAVVWAVDAFSKDFATHARTACAIRAHAPESEIHPVYILSEEMFSGRGYSGFLRAALRPRAHHNLQALLEHELLADLKRSGVCRRPRVLIEPSANASLCTGKLLRYAKRIGAELIAFGSTGKRGISRWFAGSFSETLMTETDLPLLIAGPHQQHQVNASRAMIVPTEFRRQDRAAFEALLRIATRRGLALHLIYRAEPALEDLISGGGALLTDSWISIDALFDNLEGPSSIEAKDWLRLATEAQVETRLSSPLSQDSFCEAVLDYARKLEAFAPVIALLTPELPGRLTRDLIRSSPYPLFVSHA